MAEEFEFGEMEPEEGRPNRTFLIVAGVLGGLVVVSLVLLALYTFFLAPNDEDGQSATQTALALTTIAQVQEQPLTPRPTLTTIPTSPPTLTSTVGPPTDTPAPVPTRTQLPTSTPSGLPATGFAEDFGIPGLFVVGLSLLVIVYITRRVRFGISD
jgi:hypothetical protein